MSVNIYNGSELEIVAGNSTPDTELSTTSTNTVQNKVVTTKINEINESLANLSMKYNPTDDYIYLKDADGNYVKWKRAYLTFDGVVFDGGNFASSFALGDTVKGGSSTGVISNPFVIDGTTLYCEKLASTSFGATYITPIIDLSGYTHARMNCNGTQISVDISSVSSGYLVVAYKHTSSNVVWAGIGVSSVLNGAPFGDYSLAYSETNMGTNSYGLDLRITKIWLD